MSSGDETPGAPPSDWSAPTLNEPQRLLRVPGRRAKRGPRVPYFLRPKPPHDWRWWVGGVGRILIATGLLMFAFVAYQLWGTGIQTAQAQHDLKNDFQHQLESTSTTLAPPDSVPSTDPVVTSTTIPTAPSRPPADGGAVLGRLIIERIDLAVYFVEGVKYNDLKKGPGHFRETPMPGQLGNAAIAGHRTTWLHPFLELDQLEVGDRIKVITLDGTYVYAVTGTVIVSPSDYAKVIPTTDPNVATLTLATCHPAYTARQRLVVQATLVADESDPVMRRPDPVTTVPSEGLPGETIPGDTVDDTVSGTTPDTVSDTTPDTTPDTVSNTTPGVTTTVAAPDPTDAADVEDAFAHGWFSDKSAIPQAILWGLVLLAVTLGAYYAGKAAKRLYVCFLVGLVPFVVVLYFFFQNVNRLLPPGL